MAAMDKGKDDELFKIRHSLAHVMAQAVLESYPEARLGIGPPIATGFYYDFDLGADGEGRPATFSAGDLEAIEKRMRQIVAEDHPFERREISADEARALFGDQGYKLELIEAILEGDLDENGQAAEGSAKLSTYRQASFEDLCRGPHVERTGRIPADAFKLLHVAGAYWRGDESRPMLQRIYGTAWRSRKELERHLHNLEEAAKRDHRKLGKELGIFFIDEEVGPGLPLWEPQGTAVIEELEKLAREVEFDRGYQTVRTPHLTKEGLFQRSGHLPYYESSMYPAMELEGLRYYIKPMNCPFHHKIFASRPRSHHELPLRLAEYGTCYRYEKSGELFGLMRVRSMQMNDAHIYCTEEQFEEEFMNVVQMYRFYFDLFDIESYSMRLSTHHPKGLGKKYVDEGALWLKTEELVRRAMDNGQVPYDEVADEAAFYGPKIDVQITSAIGREFTLATNQVDFAQPARFELYYIDAHSDKRTPLCIHRAPLGTHERMIGFLLEHYAGAFPLWLAPTQVRVIPITDSQNEHCKRLEAQLRERRFRVTVDLGADRMQAKIRDAQLAKVPYMVIVGQQEVANGTVSLRKRDGSRQNGLPVADFIEMIEQKIASRDKTL